MTTEKKSLVTIFLMGAPLTEEAFVPPYSIYHGLKWFDFLIGYDETYWWSCLNLWKWKFIFFSFENKHIPITCLHKKIVGCSLKIVEATMQKDLERKYFNVCNSLDIWLRIVFFAPHITHFLNFSLGFEIWITFDWCWRW